MLLFFSQICICRHFIIFLFSRSKAIQFGVRVFLYALNILANVSLFLFTNQPTFDLNIIKYSLEGFFHVCISKGNVPYAVNLWSWRNCSNRKAYTQSYCNVLDQHILSTVGQIRWITMCGFGNYDIIVILTSYIEDMKVTALRINAISIKRKHWYNTNKIVALEYTKLSRCINADVNVVNDCINSLV